MNRPNKNIRLAIVFVLILQSVVSSQTLRERAGDDPLSTVTYLLSTTDKNDDEEEKACLAKSLVSVNRFDEARRAIDMIESESYVDDRLPALVQTMIERGKEREASALVTFLLARSTGDADKLKMLVPVMIFLRRDTELDSLVGNFDDSQKVDLWFKMADVYREIGRTDKALATLEKTVAIAKASEYSESKAELTLQYARLGRETEALQLLQSLSDDPQLKAGEFNVVHDVADAYRALGRYSEAYEIHRQYDGGLNIDETRDLVEIASRSVKVGDRQKALASLAIALARLDPKEYGDSFNLGKIIEIYLKLGEVNKAEQIAVSVTGSDYMQQKQLLAIADHHAKAGNKTKAREILRFALEQTYKIDTSEKESGQFWTSGKWDQAKYQSQIAIRLMDLRFDKEAVELARRLTKPYLRALVLTEFVAINKKRKPSKKLSPYLEEAIQLLRQPKIDVFDSKKFDVYGITARSFAELGMSRRANEVFAETLTRLDQEAIGDGSESMIVYSMCNVGVDFDRSKIKADENVRGALRRIIKSWENDEY